MLLIKLGKKYMYKKLFLAVCISLLIPITSFAALDSNLKYGQHGQPVTEMQEFLVSQGYLNTTYFGNFYALTFKAVKAFQLANGLPSTGYWGSMSRAKAQSYLDLGASDNAEVTEAKTTIPTVISAVTIPVIPTVTEVATPNLLTVIETLVVQAPTCSIKTEIMSGETEGRRTVRVNWTSTNATNGELYRTDGGYGFNPAWDLSKDIIDNGQPRGNSVSSGTSLTYLTPQTFRITFGGVGGTVSCDSELLT